MFAKRLLFVLVICLLVAPFAANPAKAEPLPCYVPIYLPLDLTFGSGECSTFLFVVGYYAFSPGLVNAAVGANVFTITLSDSEGTIFSAEADGRSPNWEFTNNLPPAAFGLICPAHDHISLGFLSVDGGPLASGTYYLSTRMVVRHPITDALQVCTNLDGTSVPRWTAGPSDDIIETTITILP